MDLDLPWKLQLARAQTRRQFLKTSQTGLGAIALAMLLDRDSGSLGDEPEARGGTGPRTGTARPTTR